MRSRQKHLFGLLFGLALVAGAHAQGTLPDPMHGKDLTERLCSNCHGAGTDEKGKVRGDVPPFAEIARRRNLTPEHLKGAIVLPHPAMPGVPLTEKEIRDIVAYIISLKPLP